MKWRILFCSLKHPVLASRSFVVCVRKQRSSDQDDHIGKKPPQWDMFPGPTKLLLFVVWSNWSGPQNPNQIHRHQEPTRWHPNQKKFHTWWVESFVVLPQYQPFQFCSLLWYNGDLNKIQEKSESQQNRDLWWILLSGRRRSYRHLTSVNRGKKHYGSQDPWKSVAGKDGSGQPDKGTDLFEASDHYFHEEFMESFFSTNYSKLDDDRVWFSQGWKTETTTYDRSGRPDKTSWRMVRKVRPDHEEILLDGTAQSVRNGETLRDRSGRFDDINSQEVARPRNFIMANEETELELFEESRSFAHRVNDQVRKRQKRNSNVAENGQEHSMIWRMFMAVTMESAVFMVKNFQNNQNFIVNTADLTLKQMFDISAELVTEQNEISGLETIGWEKHWCKCLSLIGDEKIINLQRTKVYVFSDSVLCLGRIHQNPEFNEAWKKRKNGSHLLKATETLTESVESRLNSSGTSSQDSVRCNSVVKSKIYWAD